MAPVGIGKHRGLVVEHDSVNWHYVFGENTAVFVFGAGRERGSAGSGYGRSLSLAVATIRTRDIVGV